MSPFRDRLLARLLTGHALSQELVTGLKRAQGVARITRGGQPVGTGFLVPGELLSPNWRGDQILCTNNHVLSARPSVPGTLRPEEASIDFDGLRGSSPDPRSYTVAQLLFESPVLDADVTCCRLDRRVEGVAPTRWRRSHR